MHGTRVQFNQSDSLVIYLNVNLIDLIWTIFVSVDSFVGCDCWACASVVKLWIDECVEQWGIDRGVRWINRVHHFHYPLCEAFIDSFNSKVYQFRTSAFLFAQCRKSIWFPSQ